MRILLVNYEYPPLGGGGGVISAMLAREMAKNHVVTVLTSHGLDLPLRGVEGGVRVLRVPVYFRKQKAVANLLSLLTFVPAGIKAGKELLARERFDVVNTHFVVPTGPVGDSLARAAGLPNVLSLHGGDLYDPSKVLSPHRQPWLRLLIRRLLRRADVVVGQSSNTIANLHRFYAPDLPALRVPLAIAHPPEGVADRAAYGFAAEDVLLVTVGRLVKRKAVDQLVDVLAEAGDARLRLLVIGDGPQLAALRARAAHRGVGGRITFLGSVGEAEKFALLRMADAYASTSQHEGFGLVYLEAMACGLPVVCYDHGGQTDFLRDGQTGFVVPLNDRATFGRRLAALAGDGEARRRLGSYNRALANGYFIERYAADYERVFAAAIAGKGAVEELLDTGSIPVGEEGVAA